MDPPRRHRRLRAVAAALIVAAGAALALEPKVTPAQLNGATRLSMLAERMAKLNAQLGRDILAGRSRRALAEAAAEFDRGLREVSASAPTAEARENYLLLKHLWDEYRPAALHAPGIDSARKLAERNEEVVWVAEKGARMLHEQSRQRSSDLIVAAGTARSAAQRLAKIYLQRGWALTGAALAASAKAADHDLEQALARLREAPENGEGIALELRMADNQLAFLRSAALRVERGEDVPRQLEHVAKSADNVVEILDRAARFYETLSPRD